MRRITIVTDAWHPKVNGVVRVFDTLIPLLQKREYAVSVIHPGQCVTVPLPFYPEIRLALFPKRQVRKLLHELQPDAVHIATEGPLGLAARAICRAEGISFTTSYHTHFQLHVHARAPFLTRLITPYLRFFHGAAAQTMVATDGLAQELAASGFQHIAIWPLGVDTDLFVRNPAPGLPMLPKPVFVYFGRLAAEKNVDEFFEADLPGTKLVIGDGPERERLMRRYGDTAHFVGYKKGQELVDWLSLCDVFVFPSRSETFGLVVVEALACGIPVAAHDVTGPRDIIERGVDGFLSDDLQEAALACLQLSADACRAKALQYSWEASADAFIRGLVFRDRE